MVKANYNNIMIQVEKEFKNRKVRFLTPFGKITILKTIIIPKYNHVFISIPNPIKKLNDIFINLFETTKLMGLAGNNLQMDI